MIIGIVPELKGEVGGVYQYCLNLIFELDALAKKKNYKFILFTNSKYHPIFKKLSSNFWKILPLYPPTNLIRKLITFILATFSNNYDHSSSISKINSEDEISLNQKFREYFIKNHVDIMIYPTSNPLSFEVGMPYIFTIHDLNHRIYKEFPEVYADGEYDSREFIFRNGIKNAQFVLVDSEIGKQDVLRFYPEYVSSPEKIKVLPFLPAGYLNTKISEKQNKEVRKKYELPDKYLFYPARFWPHKNHLRIIKALGLIKKKYNLDIPIVLCGSHTGKIREDTFKNALSLAIKLGIKQNIIYLGYVEDKDMSVLYKKAQALIMPTFFGPTNIPIIEAWEFDCPVITSDIRGIREQVGKAAFLVNPRSVESIANGIKSLWLDKDLSRHLVGEGKLQLGIFTKYDYNKRLEKIIQEVYRKSKN